MSLLGSLAKDSSETGEDVKMDSDRESNVGDGDGDSQSGNSEDVDLSFPDNVCHMCEQQFGAEDEDAPEGHSCTVQASKGDSDGTCQCLKCVYIKRGSFKGIKLRAFIVMMKRSPPLRRKFRALRKRHVQVLCKNPKARPRHEQVDVKLFVKKTSSKYVDFRQEGDWYPLKEFFDMKADAETKKKLRSIVQKRTWLEKRGFKIQKDETGVDGVVVMPDGGRKKILVGTRMAATKEKRVEHEGQTGQDEAFDKSKSGLKVESQTQEEVAQNLKDVSDNDEEMVDPERDQESDSEESGFGLELKKTKKRAAPKKAAAPATMPPPMPTPPSQATSAGLADALSEATSQAQSAATESMRSSRSAPSNRVSGKGGNGKVNEKTLQQTNALLVSLQQIASPLHLWQQPARCKDADGKVRKALDRCGLLETADTDEATKLQNELSRVATRVSEWIELIAQFKNEDSKESKQPMSSTLSTHASQLCTCLEGQSADCVKAILLDLGKMLIEACLSNETPGSDERAAFFHFISMEPITEDELPASPGMFNLGLVLKKKICDGGILLQIQASLFNSWIDKLRTVPSDVTSLILSSLPTKYNIAEVLRIPKPDSEEKLAALTIDDTALSTNSTGMSIRVLTDLQKLYACHMMSDEEKPLHSFGPSEKNLMKRRVAVDHYSARLNLLFRSNNALRKMWAEGINLSKTSISNEQANAMCKDLLVKGASLRDVLKSESDPILTPELRELISGCRNFVDVAANLDDSMHDAKKDMNSLLDEIKTLCDDKTGSVISTNIVEWLSKQWNLDSDIPAEEVDLLLNSLEPLPKIAQALSLRGEILSTFLKVDNGAYGHLVIMLQKIVDFGQASLKAEDKALSLASSLSCELQERLKKAANLGGSLPSWIEAVKSAATRFQGKIQDCGIAKLKGLLAAENGVSAAREFLSTLTFGPGDNLYAAAEVLKQHELMQKSVTNPPGDMPSFVKQVSGVMTIACLDLPMLGSLLPDELLSVQNYLDHVSDVLGTEVETVQTSLTDLETLIKKYRPVLEAVEFWQPDKMDSVAWMFEGSTNVNKDTEEIIKQRENLVSSITPLQMVYQGKHVVKHFERLAKLMTTNPGVVRKLQEATDAAGKIIATMMIVDIVLNETKYPKVNESYRKVCRFMAKKFGLSPPDMAPMLKTKVDALVSKAAKSDKTKADSTKPEGSKSQKRKAEGEAKEPAKKVQKNKSAKK